MSLESFRIQPLRLDHIDAHIPDRLIAHELDSAGRILRVQLTDGGDVRDTTGTSLSLAWKHQRGASGLEPFSVVDAATGVYEVTYPSTMMLDGVATCSIQVADADSLAATRNFHVRIQDAPIDEDTTVSTETWTALELILTQGQAAVTALEEQHTEQATAHDAQMTQQASDWQAQTTAQASAHDDQMQQQASEFSTAQSTRADEFTDALTDYQAQVDAAISCPFPIGYIVTNEGEDPSTHWPGTSWERYAEGRALVGQDAAQQEFDTIGKTGGAKTHTLTEAQMPNHQHETINPPKYGSKYPTFSSVLSANVDNYQKLLGGMGDNDIATNAGIIKTGFTGSGQAHNNLQPYIVVRHWRRTA